jgi:hypothetical protein
MDTSILTPPSAGGTPTEPVVADTAPTVAVPIVAAPAKPIHRSATVALNSAVVAVGALLPILVALDPQVTDGIRSLIPNNEIALAVIGVYTSLIGLANVLIRVYRTNRPIAK